MSTVVVRRPARRPAPEIPTGEVPVDAPPEIPQETGSRWQQMLQVVPMLTGTVATALLFAGRGGGTYSYVIGAVFGFSTLGMLFTSVGTGTPKKAEMMAARRDYLRHLATLRRQVRDTITRQRAGLHYRHPDPHSLWSTVDSHRLWERRPGDGDFCVVRVAVGPQTLATPLVAPVTRPLPDLEPMTAGALRRFLDSYSVVPDLPVAVSLRSFARIFLRGAAPALTPLDPTRDLVRAMIAQLTVFHAPEDVLVAVCVSADRRAQWEWTKWLPHAMHPTRVDALGPVRLVVGVAHELDDLLADRSRFAGPSSTLPHIVVLVDGGDLRAGDRLSADDGVDGVTVLDLDGPAPRLLEQSMLLLDPRDETGSVRARSETRPRDETGSGRRALGELFTVSADDEGVVGVADGLTGAEAEALARRLSPLRLAAAAGTPEKPANGELDLADLLRLGDPHALDTASAWAPRTRREQLRVAIGVGPDGQAVELDLKESAQDGMGPHGLLIGATGSGKSELLRTLLLGLAATHSSETLNFVLVDFKGGATFTRLDRLPHVAAVITNLSDELPLVDRMTDAINGELVRRQDVLRRAGNYASVREYERARAGGAPFAPLPSLLIVCDEFSELLTAKPDFIDLFLQIGRLGRSLGVHLLLASQRLEEGRLRGLDTHLSYRIGLRTFSALESRTVLGVPDAYELPRSPGHGYLKFGTEPLTRFKAAYVSGPHRSGATDTGVAGRPGRRVREFGTWLVPPPDQPAPATTRERDAPHDSLLDIVADRLAGQGVPAHQVWLPPLSTAVPLDDLLGPVTLDQVRGLSVADPRLRGTLRVPVAQVDKPFEQRRDLLWMRLDGAQGHVAVVGGPQSGKSTALRTLITALALTHTTTEIQVYCLDFGGGQLAALRDLPHVGGVAGRTDVAAVRRAVSEIATLLDDRERRFAATDVDSMSAYRLRRAAAVNELGVGAAGADPWGDVFLVVDGWATIRGEYDDLEPVITDLATRGLSYGIHVVAAASRWTDFRPATRDLFGSRLELRLGDPGDSVVSRRTAANVPERSPGRGLTGDALHFLVAQPRLGGVEGGELVKAIAAAWSGPHAPPVRLLPDHVPYADIRDDSDPANPLALPIGLAEHDLRPVRLDFAADPHFLLFGDSESGKSTFLLGLATTITTRFTPEQARIVLVDYRRSLLGAITTDHLIGYGGQPAEATDVLASVADYMRRRLPGAEVTPEQLRARSWWTGPECFVLVDDYDLVVGGPTNPLLPLLEFLPQARDVGLHLVVARRSGGAARALFEPVVQRLRELSTPGLVMSGDRDEGALLGNVRPAPMPAGRGWLVTRREGSRLVHIAQPGGG